MASSKSEAPEPLAVDALCWRCAAEHFTFETTDDLEDLSEVIGQARAVEAIQFAIGMRKPGYNLYALGPEGTGKHTLVRKLLEARAGEEIAPPDWCYVSNFRERREPRALQLASGRGLRFQEDMTHFVEDVRDALRNGFESDEYRTRRKVIEEEFKERQEKALEEIEAESRERNIALLRTPMGFAFAPTSDGQVIAPEVFQRFPQAERSRVEKEIEALQEKLQDVLQQAPLWMKETRQKLRQLNNETAHFAVAHPIDALKSGYSDLPAVLRFLDEVRDDVVENVEEIVTIPEKTRPDGAKDEADDGHPVLRRYRVNLIVDNAAFTHAPVVYEDDPTYDRLLGKIEHRVEMGTLVTDFHLIRPGALLKANGGALILDARKLLTRPMAWEGLKRALLAREVRIQPLAQALGMLSTISLEPEPIPLDVKVVIVGERMLYYLLTQADPEFSRLFKVAADFDEQIPRNSENDLLYARLIKSLLRKDELRPLDRDGVARALELSAREAGDAERFSIQLESLSDLLHEADHLAGRDGRATVGAGDVQKAADARIHRLDRVRERIQEQIERGTVVIATEGTAVGQINGLSVMGLGGISFGRPSRITARVRLGKGEVVDIEREVALGGPLHSKGVLILGGYLSAHYASERPLSLSASLVFEQSYGGVDGDSASSAELYALISAISGVPLAQNLAVTGSVNQYGEVQAIGGVNEKIEGFFDLCAARGLTGDQGVMIPASNVKHLMLHRRVVEAAEAGRFRVYPVETIDQGIEILTGQPAGERGPDGQFPEGSVNAMVEARLIELAEKRRSFARGGEFGQAGVTKMEQTTSRTAEKQTGRQGRRRRVLVALDPCEADFADFEASARLAAGLGADLVGLMIEDLSLVEAADLPVTRLVPARCRELANVDAAAMRRALRVAAERAREGLSAAARRWHLECSFEVTQTAAAARTVAGLAAADLLALQGIGGAGRLRLSQAHGRLRAAGAPCPVLVLRRGDAARRPVAAVYEGEARILEVARDLARAYESPLLILAAAGDEARLLERARGAVDWLRGAGVAGRVETWLAGNAAEDPGTISTRLRAAYPGFIVIDERGALGGSIDPESLAERARASLVVLGHASERAEA